ncbi:PREDICTED: 3-hydroxybutyrate dehydrogenase type 2-like [Amphimedon queenslandica]|uniref:Dehydrogenase/reductase SDR family member 6 n=1 Tax=Amphimedon queenslandica TaxID=400682 RepID=A0A1X7VKK7_AMPQE|nr:PREDICTED: 3-hydroxybutyrate dehydrogenase type 2-like [Amphimedon queenslandica]|eukprot:XP_003384090.1 PREDICTED: 3-hydroxybutyrate dehydrogenase type 2-like [Amphimedon queenslandica]
MAASGKRLIGKSVLITGAAQGIGRASAMACRNEGAHVIATDLNVELLKELQKEFPDIQIDHLDVTDEDEVKSVINKYTTQSDATKNISVLFNCAGFVHHGTVVTTTTTDWDRSFTINVKSMFLLSKYTIDYWLKSKVKGSIINMASVASSMKGAQFRCAYGATKAAVIGLSKSIATDYVEKGIRCNCICPGTVDTPSLRERFVTLGGGDAEKGREEFTKRQKMGRLATAKEVAAMVVYLASEETAFITGTEFKIDGGWSL